MNNNFFDLFMLFTLIAVLIICNLKVERAKRNAEFTATEPYEEIIIDQTKRLREQDQIIELQASKIKRLEKFIDDETDKKETPGDPDQS